MLHCRLFQCQGSCKGGLHANPLHALAALKRDLFVCAGMRAMFVMPPSFIHVVFNLQ
jgi:hypothetical protein